MLPAPREERFPWRRLRASSEGIPLDSMSNIMSVSIWSQRCSACFRAFWATMAPLMAPTDVPAAMSMEILSFFSPFPDAYLVCSAAPASAQYQRSLFHVITSLRCHEGSAALVVRPLRVCAGPGCHIELYYMSRGASIGRRMSSRRSRIFTAPGSERRERIF